MTNQRRFRSRSGFTLTEIMVAITVIAILAGMLMAAVIPAMSSARRTAILMEMKQIEQSIENFKTHHGFYPPSWVRIRNSANPPTALLKYINRVAPNNREGEVVSGSNRRIDLWWQNVGQNIDHATGQDLVFWLSGMLKNKQYPVTNGVAPGSYPTTYDDATLERDVFYEFKGEQLVENGLVASYMQQANTEAPFLYIDAGSYNNGTSYDGYYVQNNIGTPFRSYENPKSFQLITWGLDKLPVDPDNPPANPTQWGVQTTSGLVNPVLASDPYASDNLCNFCDGMLDRYLSGTFDSSAVK
ncbi:MAG: type II secretion system protein [Mariniblastus sp.]